MSARKPPTPRFTFAPLTADRWPDLERLFGARGACAGCWCMWWRLTHADWVAGKGEGNRAALRALVDAGAEPGMLAYDQGEPVGWCALAPRTAYPRLARSRSLKPIDDQPVWSITCFFVARGHRRQGLTIALLAAAAEHAKRYGGRVLEAYPVVPRAGAWPDAFAYTGPLATFAKAGFVEVARPSASRTIVRCLIK